MERGFILEEQEEVLKANHFVIHGIVASSFRNRLLNVTRG